MKVVYALLCIIVAIIIVCAIVGWKKSTKITIALTAIVTCITLIFGAYYLFQLSSVNKRINACIDKMIDNNIIITDYTNIEEDNTEFYNVFYNCNNEMYIENNSGTICIIKRKDDKEFLYNSYNEIHEVNQIDILSLIKNAINDSDEFNSTYKINSDGTIFYMVRLQNEESMLELFGNDEAEFNNRLLQCKNKFGDTWKVNICVTVVINIDREIISGSIVYNSNDTEYIDRYFKGSNKINYWELSKYWYDNKFDEVNNKNELIKLIGDIECAMGEIK